MKKILYLFILGVVLMFPNVISGKTVRDVACDYKIYNPNNDYMTDIQIQIIDYNDGSGSSDIDILYRNEVGKMVPYDGPTYEWLNYEYTNTYSNVMLRIFTTDKKGKEFIKNYKANNKCPSIVSNLPSNGLSVDIENHVLDTNDTSKTLNSTRELLRNNDAEGWLTREDFYKDASGNTTVKDDLVCEYSLKFDTLTNPTPVVFTTMYNPTTGAKTYKARVEQAEYNISNLSDTVTFELGQGSSSTVKIEGEHLQKIFASDTCLSQSEISQYYDTRGFYFITTDKQGGDYDPNYDNDSDIDGSGVGIDIKEGCDIFSNDLKNWLIQLLDIVKIGALVLTLILGMLDFFKGVASGEADAMKKIWKSFTNRLIVLVILFLLPLLIEFIFGLINISGINSSNPLCGIK